MTKIRQTSELPKYFDQFQEFMATAAGRQPRDEGRHFSHTALVVIPDRLLTADPREVVTEMMGQLDRSE